MKEKKILENILQMLGSKKPFLKDIEIDEDGHRQPFTKSGNAAYEKMIEIIYAAGEITGADVSDIVETLDNIAEDLY